MVDGDAGSGGRFGRIRARPTIKGLIAFGLAVVVAGAVIGCGIGAADNNRGFTQTGPMTAMRNGPSTALLQDGRVLFAGGGNNTTQVASAELFDPSTGTFRATGSMSETHQYDPAAVLPDGRVLVIGLNTGNCDLYDPKSGTFSPTGKMVQAHIGGTATLLLDGRVLVAGGRTANGSANESAELFDPRTGEFSPTGSMTSPRLFHTATLLADGRVLMAGGGDDNARMQTSAELFDPKSGTFSPTGAMAISHDPQTAVSLADGRALVVGGGRGTLLSPPAEIFDPRSGQFSNAGSIAGSSQDLYHFYYYEAPPIRLQDGRVLFWSELKHSFWFFDPKTGEVSVFGRFDPDLVGPVVLLSDGQVLFGGSETMLPIKGGYLYRP